MLGDLSKNPLNSAQDNAVNSTNQPVLNVNQSSQPIANQSSMPVGPWDEEVGYSDGREKKQPTQFGSLDQNSVEEEKPFALPQDLTEKVGNEIPAGNYISSNKLTLNELPGSSGPNSVSQPQSPLPVQSSPYNIQNNNPSSQIAPPAFQSQNQASQYPSPTNQNIAVAPNIAPNLPASPYQGGSNLNGGPGNVVNGQQNAQKGLLSFFRHKNKVNNVSNLPPGQSVAMGNQLPFRNNQLGNIFSKHPAFMFTSGVLLMLFLIVFLTENGSINIGAEKVYGGIGFEKIWGGLSPDAEPAVIRAAYGMSKQSDYKVDGSIVLTVNQSVDSNIISPLIDLGENKALSADLPVGPGIKSIKASSSSSDSSSDSSADEYYITSESDANADSSTAEPSTTDNTDSSSSSDPTADSEDTSTSTDDTSTTATDDNENSVLQIDSDVKAKISTDAIETDFNFKNSSDQDSVKVINSKDSLYVQNGSKVIYDQSAESGAWILYTLSALKDKEIQKQFFNINASSGFSIKGKRVLNEQVDGIRCYKYTISRIELGDSLEGVGITSNMIESISGDVWIGIKDKLIKKTSLNFVFPLSSGVSKAKVDLNFTDYGTKNQIAIPDNSQAAVASDINSESNQAATSNNGSGQMSTETNKSVSPDQKRKNDIQAILNALSEYKIDNGSYPLSSDLLKLNTSSNIIEQALVPNYLKTMPKDPKDADGWYYAYKSDGNKCSVSARLEDPTDIDGQMIGSAFLYLKYNNN